MANKYVKISVVVALIVGALGMAITWFRSSPFDCEEVASKIRASGAHIPLERWIESNAAKWDGHNQGPIPNHRFGYGSFVVPVAFDYKSFGLEANAEAQAITDLEGSVMAVQLVDSNANIIVVNLESNQWYQWDVDSLSTVSDRTGVICSNRD